MNRLPRTIERNTYVDQIDGQAGDPINEQIQNQTTQPVMRQRATGREDDEDEKDQTENPSLLAQYSQPQLISRSGANQAALQLEPKDEENFVYTKKHFYDAIEKDDRVALVRMLRHGVNSPLDGFNNGHIFSIAKNLIDADKPEILAELIRENSTFSTVSLTFFQPINFTSAYSSHSSDNLPSLVNFVKAIDNHRALSHEFKKNLLQSWLVYAAESGKPDLVKMVIQLESSLLSGEAHDGYLQALEAALTSKNNLHELIMENIFSNESQVKIGINAETCAFAAGLAVAISRLDWAILLQNEKSKIEKSCGTNDPSFPRSLAGIISSENKNNFMEDLLICLMTKKSSNKSSSSAMDLEVFHLYEASSENSRSTAFYCASNALIKEGIRPDVAEIVSDIFLKCCDALALEVTQESEKSTDQDSSDGSYEESDDDIDKFPNKKMLQYLLANQLRFLIIEGDQADELTVQQVSALNQIGKDFIDSILRDIPKLVDDCFNFINAEFILDTDQLQKLLTDLCFPTSLARFLAEAMDEVMTAQVSKPVPALPSGLKIKDVNKYLKTMLKENASREFKNNFSEIIKRQQLMTLFNEDAKGREDLWTDYFYAYLDALKAALPSPKTEH